MKAQMFNYNFWINETNPQILEQQFTMKLEFSGFNVLKKVSHHFKPFGYTSLILLSESHLAIHTFPEENKSYIETSSCIEAPFNNFIESLKYTDGIH